MRDDTSRSELDSRIIDGIRNMAEQTPPEGFSRRVMQGLAPKRPSLWLRIRLWATRPRSVTFTPARAVPVLAAVMILLAVGFYGLDRTVPDGGVKLSTVRFVLNDAGMKARTVSVIGSFNGWKAEESAMRYDSAAEAWVLEAQLPSGDHEYMYLVDGQKLMADPNAQMTRDDGFGNKNSLVIVNGAHEQIL